jgi:hypothetical protein
MTNSTDLDVWNPCRSIAFHVSMTEGTVQIDFLFVDDMIEKDGLIDRFPRKDREDREEDTFGLNLKSMVGNNGKKKDQNDSNEKA